MVFIPHKEAPCFITPGKEKQEKAGQPLEETASASFAVMKMWPQRLSPAFQMHSKCVHAFEVYPAGLVPSLYSSHRWSSQEFFLLSNAKDGHSPSTGPHITATLCGMPWVLMSSREYCSSCNHLFYLPDEEMVLGGVVIHPEPHGRTIHIRKQTGQTGEMHPLAYTTHTVFPG